MITKLNAAHWDFYTPQTGEDGSPRSMLLKIDPLVSGVDLEIRSPKPLTLSAVTEKGEVLPLSMGQFLRFNGKLEGFVAFEIVATDTFAYRSLQKAKWLEVPDQTRLTVDSDQAHMTPTQLMIRDELKRYVAQLQADNALADDISVEELYDDINSGEHEFEAEPDLFGLAVAEQQEALEQEQIRRRQMEEDNPPPPVAEPETPPAPPPAPQSAT